MIFNWFQNTIFHFLTTYENSPGNYSIRGISEILSSGFQIEFESRRRIRPSVQYDKFDSIFIESDNITMRTKLIVEGDILALTFNQKSFFDSILGLSAQWVYRINDE